MKLFKSINLLILLGAIFSFISGTAYSQELKYRYKADGVILGSKIVIPNNAPVIGTLNFPIAGSGVDYSYTLPGSDSDGDTLTWGWSGNTPSGLSLDSSTGEISGTPGTTGTYNFDISLSDGSNTTIKSASLDIGDCTTGPVETLCADGSRYGGIYNGSRVYVSMTVEPGRSHDNAINGCIAKGNGYRLPANGAEATSTVIPLKAYITTGGPFYWTAASASNTSFGVNYNLNGYIGSNQKYVTESSICVRN